MGVFFGFAGRIGRGTWWLGQLLILGIIAVLILAMIITSDYRPGAAPDLSPAFVILLLISVVLVYVISLCTTVKRYHDRGKSGWWYFIAFVPLIGGIWQLIELGFCAGDDADNDYGPPPGAARRKAALEREIQEMSNGRMANSVDAGLIAEEARRAVHIAAAPRQSGAQQGPVFGKRT
ncbi:MAG: DUF805 domain-containing protein [Proteobacteria bacterium]|nr:DUF805 domain-containing protein [Pseudomonadota bacterium]